jgi:hypothetical protein
MGETKLSERFANAASGGAFALGAFAADYYDAILSALRAAESPATTDAAAMREKAAKVARQAHDDDLAYADKYPDEARKMEERAHRARVIADIIDALPLPPDTRDGEIAELRAAFNAVTQRVA